MSTIIEKEIYGSSVCYWAGEGDIPTYTTNLGESYDLNTCSVDVYRNRDMNPSGGFPPTQKLIKSISIEPLWFSGGYLDMSSVLGYTFYLRDAFTQPFIASKPANNGLRDYFPLSATSERNWQLNEDGAGKPDVSVPALQTNDVHSVDKIILKPWEELKIRMYGIFVSGTTTAGAADPVREDMFARFWNPIKVAKVRVELEDFSPDTQYYERYSLNNLKHSTGASPYASFSATEDITLLDLREASPTLSTKPFHRLALNNSFSVENLDFIGAFPWTGNANTTRFLFSILLYEEGNPPATRYIRKYVKFIANEAVNPSQFFNGPPGLEAQRLLAGMGPLEMKRGQYLVLRVYAYQSYTNTTQQILASRQMPAIWLNGVIT